MKKSKSRWSYPPTSSPPNPRIHIGFVYCIHCKVNGKSYIGRKNYWFRKGRKYTESDWKTYTGSSKALNEDILKYGIENFTFTILHEHRYISGLKYAEVKEIILRDALPSEEYYNAGIEGIRFRIVTNDCGTFIDYSERASKGNRVRSVRNRRGDVRVSRPRKSRPRRKGKGL